MLILHVKWQTECTGGNLEVGCRRISFPTLCHQIFGRSIILFVYLSKTEVLYFFLTFPRQKCVCVCVYIYIYIYIYVCIFTFPWLETIQVSNWQTVLLHTWVPQKVGSSFFLEEYRDDEL